MSDEHRFNPHVYGELLDIAYMLENGNSTRETLARFIREWVECDRFRDRIAEQEEHVDDNYYYNSWHPEYNGYVYQPVVEGHNRFIEPFVTEKEAQAFLKGVALSRCKS